MTAAITNPGWHNQVLVTTSIVHRDKGQPVTDTLVISRGFWRTHKKVLLSLDGLMPDGTTNGLTFKPVHFTVAMRERRMIELTVRGALIATPFTDRKNSWAEGGKA